MATTSSHVSRRSLAKVGGGFAVAAVLLYLFGWVVGWGEIVATIRTANPLWLGLAVAATVGSLVAWAMVWGDVLDVLSVDLPFSSVVTTFFAITFADYVTPFGKAGGGPFVAYFLSTDEEITFHEGLASVTSTDVLNLLPQFSFAAIGIAGLALWGELPPRADLFVAAFVGFALLAGGVVAVLLYRRDDAEAAVVGTLSPLGRYLPFVDEETIGEEVREFSSVVGRIADHPQLLEDTMVYSFGGWVLFAAPLYLVAQSVGIDLTPWLVLFVVAASSLASMIPTPGGIGGVEFAMTGLLVALAPIGAGAAAAVTLLYRVTSYWFVIVAGGGFALYRIYAV